MATSSVWKTIPAVTHDDTNNSVTTSAHTMQEIMDEEFARQLYEEECRAFERELNPSSSSSFNIFDHLQSKPDRERQLFGADSFTGDDDDEDKAPIPGSARATSASVPLQSRNRPLSTSAAKSAAGSSKMHSLDNPLPSKDAGSGFNSLRENIRKQQKNEKNGLTGGRVEAAKRATRSGVLDERTERILQKMINRGELDEVHGEVRTGKEAHVYYARGTDEDTMQERHYAVKIFKTTLNEFSNRHEYVTGDRRYDLNFHKKTMRRQLQLWTDKEYRNLCRAITCVRAPAPKVCKEHVLVMDFIGDNGWPAPTLKEAELTHQQLAHSYADVLQAIRTLYQKARLVHGDLSEYNILHYKQQCWMIDFGQAMDRSHPDNEEYLMRDIRNIHRFFQHKGLEPAKTAEECGEDDKVAGLLSDTEAFEFVVTETPETIVASYPLLEALLKDMKL